MEAEIGHNSTPVAGAELKSFIERAERLEEERKTIGEDLKELFLELKGRGFDVKVVKTLLKLRKGDKDEQAEFAAILATYASAIGFQLPLAL